ncbi:MAG: outer membrane protein, partial [Legionella sp.]
VGINIQPQTSHLSANIGYRYYYGGDFEGPTSTFSAIDGVKPGAPWQGTLKTNQMFVEFKYTV